MQISIRTDENLKENSVVKILQRFKDSVDSRNGLRYSAKSEYK